MTYEEEKRLKEYLESVCKEYIKEFELKYNYKPDVLFICYQRRRDVFVHSDIFKAFGNFNNLLSGDNFNNIRTIFDMLNELNFNDSIQYFYCYKENSEITNDYYSVGNFKIGHSFHLEETMTGNKDAEKENKEVEYETIKTK